MNSKSIYNSSLSSIGKNEVCLVKDSFTKKTQKTRRNEYKKFINAGGSVKDVRELTPAELADIYLFYLIRNSK
ncbi:hypothetical protein [Cedecea davisae]|uniref:hypothetical protein n=1 Tax=Cedecea davisae TaxID=158484 RepID=UPI003C6C4E58